MSFVIVSVPGDVHAYAMDWALRRLGQSSRVLEAPLRDHLAGAEPDDPFAVLDDPQTCVVFRRGAQPALVRPDTQRDVSLLDASNMEESSSRLERDLEGVLALRFRCFNKPSEARLAAGKVLHMEAAAKAGLAVPRTRLTQDGAQALRFCDALGGQAVFKPYRHNVWCVGPCKLATSRTQLVESDALTDCTLSTPAIFQAVVEKRAEIRVCVFAERMISVRQRPRNTGAARPVDWRRETRRNDVLTEHALPGEIRDAIRRLCDMLNVQIATLDLAEDPQGRLWFLDFNPNGQFLYLEDVNPDLPVLRTCAQGLLDGREAPRGSWRDISYARFLEEGYPDVRAVCEAGDAMLPLRVRKTFELTDLAQP